LKKRVLVIDDDPLILELIQTILEAEGHSAELLLSGETAVERVRATRPNLVLLDIVLRASHGMEVLAALRQAAPTILVVLLSGAVRLVSDMPDVARALGAHDYIEKPFDAERLLAVVEATR
jgi:DNA-binding response OmpR family regulator